MCYEEGRLLAYLDGESPAEESTEIAAHVSACEECATTLERISGDRDVAATALSKLQPTAEVVPMPRSTRRAATHRRMRWGQLAAAAAAVLALASFALPPVRSAAASLLQVFRVQRVQTVSVSDADLKSIASALQKGGHVDLQAFGEAWIDGGGSRPATVTLDAAKAAVDFPVKLPSAESAEPTLLLTKPQAYKFKLNVSAINDALEQYGATTKLPAALDGKVFAVNVPPVLLAQYPVPAGTSTQGWPSKARGVFVGQSRSPELTVPDGVNPAQLRDVLLNLPFLPASVRDQLGAIKDWQSTLIIPNVNGTAHDVNINGVDAVVISPQSAVRSVRKSMTAAGPLTDTTAIVWNDGGVVRAVGGPIDEEMAINLAKSTMK